MTIPAQRTRTTAPVADLKAAAATLEDLRTAAVAEGRPLAVVVADHIADSQPDAFDGPDAWSCLGGPESRSHRCRQSRVMSADTRRGRSR